MIYKQAGTLIPFSEPTVDWKSIDLTTADTISQGRHSVVYKAKTRLPRFHVSELDMHGVHVPSPQIDYAVKVISWTDQQQLLRIVKEVVALVATSSHLQFTLNDAQVMIATKWYDGGTLEQLLPSLKMLKLKQPIPHPKPQIFYDPNWSISYPNALKQLVESLLTELMDLNESKNLLHRDLRLSNFIFHNESNARFSLNLIDYGFAAREDKSLSFTETERSADPYFYCVHPPEVINGTAPYSHASEVWSVGMIILSLWTCDKPFGDRTNEVTSNICLYLIYSR